MLEEYKKLYINERDLSNYRKIFVQNNDIYNIYSFKDERWYRRKGMISNELLCKHFAGIEQLSTFANKDTDYVVIDIDQGEDLLNRYQALLKALIKPSFVVRSSNSNGLHCYWLLEERLNTKELITGLRIYLEKKGLKIRNGIYEIRPDERNSIRLPLSSNCIGFIPRVNYLLNDDLSVMQFRNTIQLAFSQSIEYMSEAKRHDFSDFLTYKPEPLKLPEVSGKIKAINFRKEVVEEGTRNETWMIWVQDFTKAGYNRQQMYDAVIERMSSEEWYKGSKDWERNEIACRKELIQIINHNFRRRAEWLKNNNLQEKFIKFEKLCGHEINKIIEVTEYDLREQVNYFKLMSFLKNKIKNGQSEVHIASKVFTELLAHKSRRHNFEMIKKVIDKGLLKILKNPRFGNGVENLATLYKINTEWFDLEQESKYDDLIDAIRDRFTEKEIRKLFTRTAISKILGKQY